MSKRDYEMIVAAVRDSRPVSKDMSLPGVAAAHHALDMFVHNFADREVNRNPLFDRDTFAIASDTPLNRFER